MRILLALLIHRDGRCVAHVTGRGKGFLLTRLAGDEQRQFRLAAASKPGGTVDLNRHVGRRSSAGRIGNVNVKPVQTAEFRQPNLGTGEAGGHDRFREFRRRDLEVAARHKLLSILGEHPFHGQLAAFRIGCLQRGFDRRAGFCLTHRESQRLDLRTKILRGRATPECCQLVDAREPISVGQQQPEPCRRRFLLETPREGVRTQAQFRIGFQCLVRLPIRRRFGGTRWLINRAQRILRDLPDTVRPELGDDVRLRAAGFAVSLGEGTNSAVRVDADQVEARTQRVNGLDFAAADFRNDGHRRMVRVQLLHHYRERLDVRPHRRVVPVAFHLVAECPAQHRRMVFEFQDRFPHGFRLSGDLVEARIIEPVSLVSKPDADGDCQPEPLCFVEQRFRFVVDSPGPERVPAALGEEFL